MREETSSLCWHRADCVLTVSRELGERHASSKKMAAASMKRRLRSFEITHGAPARKFFSYGNQRPGSTSRDAFKTLLWGETVIFAGAPCGRLRTAPAQRTARRAHNSVPSSLWVPPVHQEAEPKLSRSCRAATAPSNRSRRSNFSLSGTNTSRGLSPVRSSLLLRSNHRSFRLQAPRSANRMTGT